MQKVWSQQGGEVTNLGAAPNANDLQSRYPQVPQAPAPVAQPQTNWQPLPPLVPGQSPAQPLAAPPQQPQGQWTPPPLSTSPNDYPVPQRSHKWVFMILFLVLLLASGIALLFMLIKGGAGGTPQETLTETLVNGLKTQTYNETLTTKSGDKSVTQSRIADFRKVGEPHIYIENLTGTTTKETAYVTVVGGDYYVKKHFSDDTVAKATEEEKKVLAKVNDQWIQVTKNGAIIDDPGVAALKLRDELQAMRLIVPAPILVGYFRDEDQKQLADMIKQNTTYATSAEKPAEEQIDGQAALHFKVTVDADKVKELNLKAAALLGVKDTNFITDALKTSTPNQMDVWARKSDHKLLQYKYEKNSVSYTYKYEKIDESQEVSAPKSEAIAPEGASAGDDDMKNAVSALYSELSDYADQGNALPADSKTLQEFVTQRVDQGIASRFTFQYQSGTPQKGFIFVQNGMACNGDKTAFTKGTPVNFALLTKLNSTLYCVDNNL